MSTELKSIFVPC